MKMRTFACGAVVAATFVIVSCSFGPDAYNGPGPCPGPAPADGVQTNDLTCHDYSADSGTDDAATGTDSGSAGAPGAAGASAAGGAG